MLTGLFERIRGKKKASDENFTGDLRAVVWQVACDEAGEKISKPISEEHAADIVDASGLSEADFRASVDEATRRIKQSKIATQLEEREAAALAAEEAYRAADLEEGVQGRALHKRSLEMKEARRLAIAARDEAMDAKDYLVSHATGSDHERELNEQVAKLKKEIDEVQRKLYAPASRPQGGGSYTVTDNPAAMAREARADLADIAAGKKDVISTPERKSRLAETLRAAEVAIVAEEKKLSGLLKEREKINIKLAAMAADKLSPESFRIVRSKPSRDQLQREYAKRMGFIEA